MPRIRRTLPESLPLRHPELVHELAEELKRERPCGQPLIEEQLFTRTNLLRVAVVWDRWEAVPDEERAATILQAYEQVEGKDYRDRIALPIGVTVPEAVESGLLPYRVAAVLRKGDPVTEDQCRQAMLAQGASTLMDPNRPLLGFARREEAEACVRRLIAQLPGSETVWVIQSEVPGRFADGTGKVMMP